MNSSQFYELVIPRVIESRVVGIKLDRVKISKVNYSFPDQFRFKNVEVDLAQQDENYSIKIINLGIDRLSRLIFKYGSTDISVSLRSFSTKDLEINYSDFQITLLPQDNQSVKLEGKVFIAQSVLAEYQLNNAEIIINGNLNRIGLTLIKASFYGGDLAGQIWIESAALKPYMADLRFDKIESARLDEIYRELKSNFRGLISGTINVSGNKDDIKSITFELNAGSGAELKAWFVGWLIDFVPGNEKLIPKELKDIIKMDGFLTADALTLGIRNTSDRTIQAEVNMKIRKYYVNPHYTYDINIDGRLVEVLKRVERALKTGGFYGPR